MLSPTVKADLRRHLRYEASMRGSGLDPRFGSEVWHNSTNLETRFDLLEPITEAQITGAVQGVLSFVGMEIQEDWEVSVTFTSAAMLPAVVSPPSPGPITIGPVVALPGDTKRTMAEKLTNAIMQNNTLLTAGFQAGGPWGPGFGGRTIELPQVIVTAPKPFTMAVTVVGMAVVVEQQGIHVHPAIDFSGGGGFGGGYSGGGCGVVTADGADAVVADTNTYGYLPILNALESLIGSTSLRMGMIRSDGFVKGDEFGERVKLYNFYRKKLMSLLGVELGDQSSYNNSFAL